MAAHRKHPGRTGQYALTPPQVEHLLANVTHLEDEALLRLAISTGIRREDIVSIRLEGVNLERGLVTYYEAKKNRTRTVPISGRAQTALAQHVRTLPKGTRWLFPANDPRRHVSSRTAYNILQRWLERTDLPARPFHALRSTCIKLAQYRGWTAEQVSELTGDTWRVIKEHYDTPSDEEMAQVAKERPIT